MSLHHFVWAVGFTEARIKRGPYWLTIGLTVLVQAFVVLALDAGAAETGWGNAVVLALMVGNLYAWLVIAAGRCRDAGHPGWFAFLTLVPLLGQAGAVILGIKDSRPDPAEMHAER